MRRILSAAVLLSTLLFCLSPASAQRFAGTISGTVTDASGAVVSGAEVKTTHAETGASRTARTNENGYYTFAQLPIGTYSVEVTHQGFKQSVKSGVVLHVADTLNVPVQLTVGGSTETVNVEATQIQVNTESGEVAGLVTGQQVRELPLNGRNFTQLVQLMPGVSTAENFDSKNKGLQTGVDISISGGGVTNNLWLVDGANNNDVGSNRTILVYPSVDAIAEFKIHRNNFGAEFGQAAGAQINIVTRQGGNQFHGSAYYFGRNDVFNARNYFLARTPDGEKDKVRRHDYGFSLGGPIVADRAFFFWSEEWNTEKRGTVRTALVPTAANKAGDFSVPNAAGCGPGTPVDPLTGSPFPGNIIPAGRISPAGQLYVSLYPDPNVPCANGTNWIGNITTPIDWRQDSIRGDMNLTNSMQLMLRYTKDTWVNGAPNANTYWGDDPFPGVDSTWNQPGRSAVAKLTNSIGNTAVNSIQFSYSGNVIDISRGGDNTGLNDQINAALPAVFGFDSKSTGDQVGHPVFWGGGGYPTLWNQAPWTNNQDLWALKDDFSKVIGSHSIKIGGLYGWNAKNEVFDCSSCENSQFWGSTGINTGTGAGATTGNIISDFLLRDMTFGFSENRTNPYVQTRWKDLEAYIGDTWKVSDKLTLDLGLRYSLFMEPYDENNRIAAFVPSLFDPALGNAPCNGLIFPEENPCAAAGLAGGAVTDTRSLRESDKNNFAPRFGFAWNLFGTGKSVLRGGIGQFFQRERVSPYLGAGGANPPFNSNVNGSRTLDSAAPPFATAFAVGNGAPARGMTLNAVVPNSWQWNLMWEQELARDTVLELGYVANRGIHLTSGYAINQVPAANRLAYARSNGTDASLRPFSQLGNSNIGIFDRTGDSIYHSLQTQFRTRFGRGSHFQMSYTWSRLLENAFLGDSSGNPVNTFSFTDLANPELDRGPSASGPNTRGGGSGLHRPHIFNASLVYLTPQLTNANPFARGVFGDWEIANILLLNHGQAVTVTTGGLNIGNGPSGTGFADNNRPNRVAGEPCRAQTIDGTNREQILNPAAFTMNGFQLGSIGNAGRGSCYGPGIANVDLAIYKNWQVPFFRSKFTSEKLGVQFRWEIFNLFNRANFRGSSVDLGLDAETISFDTGSLATANTITGWTPGGTFGSADRVNDPRQMQFALKFTF